MAAVLVVSQWLRVSSAGTLGTLTGAGSEYRIPGPVVVKSHRDGVPSGGLGNGSPVLVARPLDQAPFRGWRP
jgi:hypothetical protein